jgi:rsbT antagonist protein RsbS
MSMEGSLIVSLHAALDDEQLARLQRELLGRVVSERSRHVVIDVAALDVVDSFAAHTLGGLAHMARLHGAHTVVVGISPDIALALVRLPGPGLSVATALDLGDALESLPT